jgi:hypothetical protein
MLMKLNWYGAQVNATAKTAAKRGLRKCAADLQQKSAAEAPIHNGDLRANCSVTPFHETANTVSLKVGYDLPYAVKQHENLLYRHPMGGKAKYLEDPFNANKAKYRVFVAQAVDKGLSK